MGVQTDKRSQQREDVLRFVVDAADLAFTPILDVDALACVMCADPYVLGYVVARLFDLTAYACAEKNLQRHRKALMEEATQRFLKAQYPSVCDAVANLRETHRPRYLQGAADGQRHCEYLFGERDVRQHPNYRDATARESSNAERMPGRRYSGSSEAVAHEVEYFTLRSYLIVHHADRMGYSADLPSTPGTAQP